MNKTRVAPRKMRNKIYESQVRLEAEPDDRQIRSVWKIKVSPMARGCRRRVNRHEVPISMSEDRISRVISESSLI